MPNIFALAVEQMSTHLFRLNPRFIRAVVDERQSILHARPAVGDLAEIAAAELFLAFEIERAVIGRDFLQVAELQPLPQRLDVFLAAPAAA